MWLELGIILLTLLFVWHYKKVKEFPPGPFSLPIIGTVSLWSNGGGAKGSAVFNPIYYEYKDWYTLFIGTLNYVVLNDYKLNKELFSRDEFSGRETSWWHANIRGINGRNLGIITTDGYTWSTQRRFALKQLRDLGFGKKNLDDVMVEEIDAVIDELLKHKDQSVEINSTFNTAIINVLWQIVASKRFDAKDKDTKIIMDTINDMVSSGFAVKSFLPTFLAKILPLDNVDQGFIFLKKVMYELVQEHLGSMDPDCPRDFIDVYLNQVRQDPNNFDVEQLILVCVDFFLAGSETTATTLLWSVMFMTLNPQAQEKVQIEIEEVLGQRAPTIADMSKMNYCMAALMEMQRCAIVAPGSLPHTLLKDTVVNGHKFKEGTVFFTNVQKLLMDPVQFPEPEKYRPERFLDQDGNIVKNEYLVPFGIGKRICMGETLAKNEMFIFFVRMLQRLSFSIDPQNVPDPKNCIAAITRIPKPFEVRVSDRN